MARPVLNAATTSTGRGTSAATLAVAALGTAAVASYLYAAPIRDSAALRDVALVQAVLFVCAAGVALYTRIGRPAFAIVLLVGILCRVPLVLTPPRFSDDMYRYVWDGRVQAAGINPYRYVPADPALARLRDTAIYPHINRRDYALTIYPPVAQIFFFAVTRVSETVTGMKAGMVACEIATVWALVILLGRLGLPRGRVLLYAWNPLVIWQYAGDGHVDAVAITFVAAALLAHVRRREALTGAALGCATLVKWYPAVLFPALYRPRDWKMPLAMATVMTAAYLPYVGAGAQVLGFLPGYAREEGMLNGRRFLLLALARLAGVAVPPAVYIGGALATLLIIAVHVMRETNRPALGDIRHASTLAAVFMVLFSTHYLWYFGWLALFLAVVPTGALLYLTGAATSLFAAAGTRPLFGAGGGPPAFDTALYVPFALLALAERWGGARRAIGRSASAGRHAGRRADLERPELAGTET